MGNIFDEYGKAEKARKKKQAPAASNKNTLPPVNPTEIKEQARLNNYESNAIFKKIEEMKQDLDKQIADVQEKGEKVGLNPSALMKMLGPDFKGDFEVLSKYIKVPKSDDDFYSDPAATVEPPPPQPTESINAEEAMTKQRRSKMRGAKNNWLPM